MDHQHDKYSIDSNGRWLFRQSLFNCGWGKPLFEGNIGLDLAVTKNECQTACDRDSKCLQANVWFKRESYQACFLYSESDNCTLSNMRPDFHLYLKGLEMLVISAITVRYYFCDYK